MDKMLGSILGHFFPKTPCNIAETGHNVVWSTLKEPGTTILDAKVSYEKNRTGRTTPAGWEYYRNTSTGDWLYIWWKIEQLQVELISRFILRWKANLPTNEGKEKLRRSLNYSAGKKETIKEEEATFLNKTFMQP